MGRILDDNVELYRNYYDQLLLYKWGLNKTGA